MSGKKKLIRLHRVLSLVIAIALTVVIAVVVFQRSGLFSYQLSNYVNDHYLKGTPFHFSCGKITGDLVGHVSLARPVLRYSEGGETYELFRARRITLDYSLLQVLKLKMMVSNLEVEDVRVTVHEDETGRLILPAAPVAGVTAGGGVSPHVVIENFLIDKMQLLIERRGGTVTVKNIVLTGALRFVDGTGEIRINKAKARHAESDIQVQSFELKGQFGEDWVDLDDLKLRTDRSFVIASGRYQGGRLQHVQGIFNPLELGEVSKLGLMAEEEGEVGGNIVVDGVRDSLAIRGSLTGKALGLVFSGLSLKGVVFPNEIHLANVEGAVFGSRLNGDLRYQRGDGSYSFHGVCEGLDISQGFIAEDDVPETDLNGLISLEHTATQNAYEFRGDLRRSTISGFESDQMQVRLGYRETSGLTIRSFDLSQKEFKLSASGVIADGNADLIVGLKGRNVNYVADYLSLPRVQGRVDVSGRIIGPLDRFQLNLNGTWEDLTYNFGTIDSARVSAEARDVGGDDVFATIDIEGRNLDLVGRAFTAPHLLMEVNLDKVKVRDFSFSKGDTLITSDFEVETEGDESAILIKHLVLRMPHSDWVNDRSTTLRLDTESASLDTLILRSIDRQVGFAGLYDLKRRTSDIDVWGQDIDLALVRQALNLPFRLEGVGAFVANVSGEIDNPSLDLSLNLARGVVDSLEFDRLQINGGFSGAGYYLNDVRIVQGADSLTGNGSWGYLDSPRKVMRQGFRRAVAEAALVSLQAHSYGFALTSVFKAVHRPAYWGGAFEGDVSLDNTLADPRVTIEGVLVSRPGDKYLLPPVHIDMAYSDSSLVINTLSFDDRSTTGRASGSVPMSLGLGQGLAVDQDGLIEIDIGISSKDLSPVAGYFNPVAMSAGKMTGRLRITGSARDPRYTGTLELKEGALRLTGTDEIYRGIAASLSLRDSLIELTSLSGSVGKKGRFKGSGAARLRGFRPKSYEIALNLTNYKLTTIRDFESTQDGQLRIRSRLNPVGKTVPEITGSVVVTQAVITKSIGREEGPPSMLSMPTESPGWLCNIDIDAANNVWLRNPDLNMELGGALIMKRDRQGLYFRGDLSVLRGSYTLYNNKFRITDGRIDFSTATTLRPDIHLNAYTPHRVAGQQERRIFLDLTWPSDKKEPTIALSYDAPGYSETDLWKMLGGQVVTGDPGLSSGGPVDAATGTAQNIASNYLERILNAQMRDVTVDVESRTLVGGNGFGNSAREMSIAVGRYLSEDLYLNYRQGLTVTNSREVDVEYRISNMFLLRSEIIRNQGTRGIPGKSRQTTDEVNFDIKFRFEY
ncbi:MAG: translocation/assembly module TamB [Candidatus Krumholzibacteria bacterium]|nr:translocation/assembly module TamB [Candidatus Krumholzibacteria bacterium]